MHVAAYIRELGKGFEKPTVKQHLAAIRMLFDWLVVGQVDRHQSRPFRARAKTRRQARQDAGADAGAKRASSSTASRTRRWSASAIGR